MATPEEFLEQTREQGLKELEDFLRIPSISSQPEHADDVRRAAGHLAEQYERVGLENAQVIETGGHPVVYADWPKARKRSPARTSRRSQRPTRTGSGRPTASSATHPWWPRASRRSPTRCAAWSTSSSASKPPAPTCIPDCSAELHQIQRKPWQRS